MLCYTVTCVIHRCLLAAVLNYTPNIYILPLEGRIVLFCAGPSTLWALRAPVLHFSLLAHKLLHILIHYTCRHHPVIQRSHYISPPVYNTQDFPLCIMHCLDFVFLISLFFKMKVKQKQTKFFHNILIFVLKHVQMTMWLTAGLIMAHMSHMHILSLPWLYVAEHRPHVLTHTRWVMIPSLSYLFPVLFKPGPLLTSGAKSPSQYFPWTPTHVRVIQICSIVAVIYFV